MKYIPYTYLIGWTSLNLWYYGSKYGNGANPKTFWIEYFTSSNKVAYIRDKYGEPDVIQIRKTFKDAKSCTAWEYNVLKKILSPSNPNINIWINQNVGFGEFYKENNVPEYLSYKRMEYLNSRTEDQKKRDYESRLKAAANPEGKRKISEKAKARYKDPEYKAKMEKLWKSEEFSKIRSEASKKAMDKNGQGYANHSAVMKSEAYRKKVSDATTKALSDPLIRKKMRDASSKYHSNPENIKKKSEYAKASSANRIFTKFARGNKLKSKEEYLAAFHEKYKNKHKDALNDDHVDKILKQLSIIC